MFFFGIKIAARPASYEKSFEDKMNININLDTSEETKIFDKTENREVCETFYESGSLKERWTQKNGKLHGLYMSYFESGSIEHKINHLNGKEEIILLYIM